MALTTPSILFVTLLTQMAARYTIFPAVIAAGLIGISFSASLFQLLLVIISFGMLSNQMLAREPSVAPVLYSITHPTYPDMGWMMLLLAGVCLVNSVTPSVRFSKLKKNLPMDPLPEFPKLTAAEEEVETPVYLPEVP